MKAFAPKSESDRQHVKQDRQRPASRPGASADGAESGATAFVDNRPGAVAQRQLQARMNQSPRVQHLAQRQAMINASPRQVAQRQQAASMSGRAMRGRTEQAAAANVQPLRPSTTLGSTGEVAQLAGTKPNQPSVDGRYRIKLSSEREKFSYKNRGPLGLDRILPQHHPLKGFWHLDGEVTAVVFMDDTVVRLKTPIPMPSGGKQLLCIDTVGYEEPEVREEGEQEPAPSQKLFMDVKIGHYTKSGQQWELEGAGLFMQIFKKLEHDMKDRWRYSREGGYDIDLDDLDKFRTVHLAAISGGEPMLLPAMRAVAGPLVATARTMARAPVTFVGASVFIVLNLTEPTNSEVKIIDPDHPILLDKSGLGAIPGGVMTEEKMQGSRDWDEYKDKWQSSFGTGMTNFLKWFDYRIKQLPEPRRGS